ncbi:MAG: hypothetical protein KY469_18410 [Actinobacteria bacterium]|nr:hypothetical protein [Actinomycetota bacterium]
MARRLVPPLLAAALVLLPGAATAAAAVDAVGWWWRAQTGIVGLPPPPNVPEGGLAVGTAPDGATAIGGVRFVLTDETPLTLTLTVADQQGIASLVACPSSVRWSSAHAGAWPSRPAPACDLGEAPGELSEDGATWMFDVSGFPAEGVLDAIIVPAGDPGAFQVSFEPPDASALATRSTAPPPPPPPAARGEPEPQPQPQRQPTQAPAPPPPPAPAPRGGTAVPPPAVPAEPQPQPQPQAPVVADPDQPIAPAAPPGDARPVAVSQEELDERDRRGALTAAAALLVMTAMVLWSSRRMGEPEVAREAGLGRFTAPRTGSPPPLI